MVQRTLNFEKLIQDVFATTGSERFVVLTDVPPSKAHDHSLWTDRRQMALDWSERLEGLGYSVAPVAYFEATGNHNADLPAVVEQLQVERDLDNLLAEVDIALVMSEYSATAPMMQRLQVHPTLRVASMPGVERRMENSALAVRHDRLRKTVGTLRNLLNASTGARVHFETGHEIYFDLRYREAMVDDGRCTLEEGGSRLINLPSGEAFQAPYEGEVEGQVSGTIGVIPIMDGEDRGQLFVEENRITQVQGRGAAVDRLYELFEKDPTLRNIAEIGLGCNDAAIVKGNVLEDEKAGFHVAIGRSDHVGGVTGPDKFASSETVLHEDLVYAPGSPIAAEYIDLVLESGEELNIMDGGSYRIPEPERLKELGLGERGES